MGSESVSGGTLDVAGAVAREGVAEVPGARLRYRLAGTPGAPILVFENGWGASFHMWAWVEAELAAHAQLLFYNRAGIGGSERLAPVSVAGLSNQFAALPRAVGLQGPVIAVGQSYGGLMCALHAAQRRDVLCAVVEIDPTPESADPVLDDVQRKLPALIGFIKLCTRLGLPNVLFGSVSKFLPPESARELLRVSLGNPASLDAGLEEFALRDAIRARIAAGRPCDFTRLLIGAGAMAPLTGLTRLLANESKLRAVADRNSELQRARAAQDPGCRFMTLPFDHGGLVFDREGAQATSAQVRTFVKSLRAG